MGAVAVRLRARSSRTRSTRPRKDGSPLVELSLFKVKSFAAGIAVQLTFGIAIGIFFLVWTLYMQIGPRLERRCGPA